MSKIQTGLYSDLLRRFLEEKGVQEVAADLSPEISPTFQLENDRLDWKFLKQQRIMGVTFDVPASAVLFSTARIRNPTASRVIATFQDLFISVVNANVFNMNIFETTTDLANLDVEVPRDTRWGPTLANRSSLIASFDNVSGAGTRWFTSLLPAADVKHIPMKLVLTPGFGIEMTVPANNQAMRGSIYWEERRLSALESA